MTDLNDINNFSGRLRSQIELAQDLDTEDSEHIIRWAHSQDVADTTLIDRLKNVRLLSDRADKPLTEFDGDDARRILDAFETGEHPDAPDGGYAHGTMRQYRQALKLYLRDELDREWADDLIIGTAKRPTVSPDKILTSEEVDALLESSANLRDTAIIAFLTVTGQRITATLSIRVGDVELGVKSGRIRLNDDAKGLKGASGPRPLLWARPFIEDWLKAHPSPEDDAPLFCCLQSGKRPKEDGTMVTWEKGDPLTRSRVATMLKNVAEEGGVPREKVKPHNFRHTAITRMRSENVSDDRIKFMVGVAPDSDILERYDQADNETMMERIRADHGLEVETEVDVGRPSVEMCPECSKPMQELANFCSNCGADLSGNAGAETTG